MSGVEVAGLILGAIPLVIVALERYEDGLGKVKAFWKWEDELADAIRKLWYQYSSYELTLRILLAPITLDTHLEAMMANPRSQHWKDRLVNEMLQEKLASTYNAYVFTMQEIQYVIEEIAGSLNLDKAHQVTHSDLEAIVVANSPETGHWKPRDFQFSKRIKFTMKKQKVKRLLDQLETNVSRLDSFNDKTEKLQPYRNSRKSRFLIPLQRVQQYATHLHHVIGKWTCAQPVSQPTNLLLEQRMNSPGRGANSIRATPPESANGATRFVLSIYCTIPARLKFAEIQILVAVDEDPINHSKVKFTVSPPSPSSSSPATLQTNELLSEITDIHSAIRTFHSDTASPGFYLDAKGVLKGMYTSGHQHVTTGSRFVTLQEMLQEDFCQSHYGTLTKEICYILAITLSSSLLQLHSTPWLTGRWDKCDIAFLQNHGDGAGELERNVQVRHPYLRHMCPVSDTSRPESTKLEDAHDTDSSMLLSLGIMLLELYFQQPIESLSGSNNGDAQSNDLANLRIAKHWVNREKGNLSWAFQNAVSYCLKCFADPTANLQDQDFQQGFIEQVLIPLQDELSLWTHGPTKS